MSNVIFHGGLSKPSNRSTPKATSKGTPRIGILCIGLIVLSFVALATKSTFAETYRGKTTNKALLSFDLSVVEKYTGALRRSLQENDLGNQDVASAAEESQNVTESPSSAPEGSSALEFDSDELSVVVTFEDILRLMVFLAIAWIMSNLSAAIGLPGLVGEIVTGFLFGPPLVDLCPFPEAMVLLGNVGLLSLMLEAGIFLDLAQLRETGTRAVLMALSGTVLALLTGLALVLGLLNDSNMSGIDSAIALGSCFSSSSLGVAAAVLSHGRVLNTPIGQLIVASSVVDDILGLILLGILNVFVKENPQPFDYVQPFLASFGFLFLLGYLGIVWVPRLIQHYILPKLSKQHHEKAIFGVMFALVLAYLPLLNYTGASFLTGAFLAGLSVSQVPSIHESYSRYGRELKVWLMRIFFTATIGFQVPITMYDNAEVFRWSAMFLLPIVDKAVLGLLVPRFQKEVPHDFPFDPYWRDVLVTCLAVICRGEFNFVIASFGLSSGLLEPRIYSGVVMAVLVSCIVGPWILAAVIRYYNRLAEDYLSMPHKLEAVENSKQDGTHPLFVAIQIRTPVSWNMHERFQNVLRELGLLVLDYRTWHTNGAVPVDMSEIFVQDTIQKVVIRNCFLTSERNVAGIEALSIDANSAGEGEMNESVDLPIDASMSSNIVEPGTTGGEPFHSVTVAAGDDETIAGRLRQIKLALEQCLGDLSEDKYAIKTTQWEPFLQESSVKSHRPRATYTFHETSKQGGGILDQLFNEDFGDLLKDVGVQRSASVLSKDKMDDSVSSGVPEFLQPLHGRDRAVSHGNVVPGTVSGSTQGKNRRSVSHDMSALPGGFLSQEETDGETPSHSDAVTNRRRLDFRSPETRIKGHVRRQSSTSSYDGILMDIDLWETDKFSRKIIGRGASFLEPIVATNDKEEEDGGDDDDNTSDNAGHDISDDPRYPHDHDPDEHKLHGYIRH